MADNKSKTRTPIQKRSIEKREKILKAGFELFCENGYHGTNTAQIAKAAGVSTGIIYQYFNDKHEIFIEALSNNTTDVFYPIRLDLDEMNINMDNLKDCIRKVVTTAIENHKQTKKTHEQIMELIHSDQEVAELFHDSEYKVTMSCVEKLRKNGFDIENLNEKMHICVGLVDNLCHDLVYHHHDNMDYDIMTENVISIISNLLSK